MVRINVVYKRRESRRIESTLPILYQPSIHQNWYMTVISSLGLGGLCLSSSEYLSNGIILKLRFLLPGSQVNINATGEVLWSEFMIDKKLFESGVRFLRLDKTGKELISNYVDETQSPQSGIPEIQVVS